MTRVSPRDAASITENPTFLSTTGSSGNFLHIDAEVTTQIESGATPIDTITNDYDGDARNATFPDIGADEFSAFVTVMNINDSGAGSLREAVNSAVSGSTINFGSALMGQTITLTTGQIDITKDLTISGPGMANLTISGNNNSRIFYLAPTFNLNLKNIALKNATAAAPNGGALFIEGNATLENLLLENNFQDGITPRGITIGSMGSVNILGNVNINE
jgi:hypothetical protein